MKKLVGLSGSVIEGDFADIFSYANTYVDRIIDSGNVPVLLPMLKDDEKIEELVKKLDGIILQGGIDVSPLTYGEDPTEDCLYFSFERDEVEMKLVKYALKYKKPILATCRGLQIVNAYFGGTLIQDIDTFYNEALVHANRNEVKATFHYIKTKENSLIRDAFKEERVIVNSLHHQSIKVLGDNLVVTAIAADGVIEAVEYTGDSFLHALQFHPEAMDCEGGKNIFRQFFKEVEK